MSGSTRTLKFIVCSTFLCVGALAYFFNLSMPLDEDPRAPAAIRKTFDSSELLKDDLHLEIAHQLISGIKLHSAGSSVGLSIGHFQIRDASGIKTELCAKYPQLKYVFHAGDMAVSGEPPTMILSGDCLLENDGMTTAPLFIDYVKVLDRKVMDSLIKNPNDDSSTIHFINVSDSWPRLWILHEVQLNSEDGGVLAISESEIRQIYGKSVSMEWPR